MWEIEVWHLSVVACFKSEWSPLCRGLFESTLKCFRKSNCEENSTSLLLLFLFSCLHLCFFVTPAGRSSLKHQSLNIRWIRFPPFLIIPANKEQVQQAATKTDFIIISMSCLCSSSGPHLPLWCLLPAVIGLCSYLNYKWNHNLLWWY